MKERAVLIELLKETREVVARNPDMEFSAAATQITHGWYMAMIRFLHESPSLLETQEARLDAIDVAAARLGCIE